MSYLDVFLKLTAIDIHLDEVQANINHARGLYGHHRVVREQLDFRQGNLDAKREQLQETIRRIAVTN